jgi:hypothetical protein
MKIDILTIIGDTYRFLATNLLSIFRIGWLPVALMLFVTQVTDDLMETSDEAAVGLVGVFANILAAVIAVSGCLRIIFGPRADQGAPGYFLFERAELRYLIAFLLSVAVGLAIAGGLFVTAQFADVDNDMFGAVGVPALLVAIVWAWLRLVPQPAVILNEGSLGFGRAWRMTRGNTFRLGAATLLCIGPVWALDTYAYHLVAGTWPTLPDSVWSLDVVSQTMVSFYDWSEQVAAAHPLPTLAIDMIRFILEYAATAGLIASVYTQLNANK